MALAACSSNSGGAAPATTAPPTGSESSTSSAAPAPTGSPGASGANLLEWCGTYASLVDVLSQTGSDAASAKEALGSLDQFVALWQLSVSVGMLNPDEAAANVRAAQAYRAVVALVAGGASPDSAEVQAARAALQNQTDLDRELLKTSAAKILGTCGGRSGTPSPTS